MVDHVQENFGLGTILIYIKVSLLVSQLSIDLKFG